MDVIIRSLIHRAYAMLFVLILSVVVGAEVSATSPRKLAPLRCPSAAERDACEHMECGPNSHFERCSKVCPPQNCSAIIDPNWLCESNCCVPECRCNDGYFRDDRTGVCISRDECLAQCTPFERFVKDSPECQRTCANYKVTGPCSLCKPFTGCVCEKGRVRVNDDGTGACVLPKECPRRQCPLHEHWDDCPSVCVKESCISKNPDYKCLLPAIPLPCKPRCICNKGYLRNHLGHCIPENHCPIKRCPINEVWRCASMCPRDSCKHLESDFKCPPGITSVCIPACACKDGYLRNDEGHCIPRERCPPTLRCGINEVVVKCKAYPPLTCESVYTLYKPIAKPPCVPGCDCRPGYLRNKRDICVPSEFCPAVPHSQCGPHQEYKECGTACEPSCADLEKPLQICSDVCVKGCFCKDGYLKDEHGNCVQRSKCPLPICNKPNEVAKDCGSYCERKTCEDYKRTDISCPAVCVRGCFCRDGYVRNAYGVCIHPEKCPPKPVCLQENEEYQSCGSSCPDNCENYMNPDRICTMNCVAGCNCKKGFVRNLKDNTCIKPEQCPTKKCTGVNEELNLCASYCPVTCANRYTQGDWACITLCREACDCIPGTLRHDNGTCVPVEKCSPPVCRQNEKYMKCGTACPLTCDNYKTPPPCTQQCVEDCFCEDGYVRDRFMRCVKPEDCEPICPAGEKFNECSAHCQDTCENYNVTNRICTYQCQSGCVCEKGTVRRKDGKCVPPTECTAITCPADEVYDPCSAHCAPTCEHNEPDRPCTAICIPGCKCGDGLVRRSDGKCVKLEQCPPPCPPSEHFDECNAHCEDTCELHGSNVTCLEYCKAGCRCNDGLVRRKDGQCVNLEDCSAPQCSANEVYDQCSAHCEPTCESNGPNRVCAAYCEPGCRCKDGLVRRKDGQCVKLEKCQNNPQCGVNERWVDCVLGLCIPLTCDQLGFPIACPGIVGPCKGGCVCAENYVRDSDNTCIPQQDCPTSKPCSDPNAIRKKCASHESCRATCAVPNSRVCPKICIIDGCECKQGYVLSEKGGKCVRIEDCPRGNVSCNGDPNAVIKSFPPPCPSTCDLPNGIPGCLKLGLDVGCECKPGYILSANDGKCILPDKCKGGNPCGANATFSWCRVNCPSNYCPVDDSRAIIACDPPYPCPSGCVCKLNYRRKSEKDDRCILSSTCPPVKCTRPNEIWDPCPSECRRENCADVNNQPTTCNTLVLNCQPQCICKKGYFRNDKGICIPAKDCPINKPCDDPNAERLECAPAPSCRATCATPNPSPCIKSCAINECVCKKGFVLSAKGGKCIPVDQCPKDAPCNGDSNAFIKVNPIPCPSTCSVPNASPWCKRYAPPVGCECKPGYLLAEDGGKCITPDKCPGGNPCGANSTFVWCKVTCPRDYCPVDDSRAPIACDPPYPCASGCICKLNYKRKSSDDDRCILSSTCPPVKCTRPNEIWDPCTSPCRLDNCKYANQTIYCKPMPLNCQPQCVCMKGYYRNDEDICVPQKECPINKPCDDPNAERMECAPAPSCRSTCSTPNPSPCIQSCAVNECVCKKGFVLSEKGGKCIPVDQCPKDAPCNGDSNAVIKVNPIPCPSTCSAPNASPWCKRYAPPVGCECKPGYLLAEDGGKCIKPDECSGGNPCGVNGTFVWCSFNCPTNNCPVSDTRAIVACSPPYPCPNGCACKLNYKRKSSTDYTCILASDCPPVNCTRPNEIWSSCPSACLREGCADVDDQPITCNTLVQNCQPRCICKKGYFRNDTDICIPAKQCPKKGQCTDPNAERLKCAPDPQCRATCADRKPGPCIHICIVDDCVCKKGYILSENNGKCIPEDQCPAKNGQCTDPNAERLKCAPDPQCRATCADRKPGPCIHICIVDDCVCKKGYILSENNGKCIPEDQCPANNPCSDPNAERVKCALATNCRPTCAKPNPGPCTSDICIKNECVCKKGYVLSEKGGKCVEPDQCPIQKSCNDDPNAQIKVCPLACPATCDAPNAIPCRKACVPIGCECKDGYILSESNGKCILPEKCKGGYPCGRNETFVSCKASCPSDFCPVSNSPNSGICEAPSFCYPGCVCQINYRRRSIDDQLCIYASECPPLKCNKNEVWSGCPSDCLQEDCSNANDPPVVCNTLLLNCQPKCICKKGYYRDSSRNCVPAKQCPKPIECKANEVFSTCRIICPPQTCASIYTDYDCRNATQCEPGCDCLPEYLRNGTDKDPCIPSNLCPTTPPSTPECGINEHYETNRNKCDLTCKNYDLEAQIGPCEPTSGCFCDDGFVRNSNGLCIPKKKCPKNIVCPKNEVVSECYNSCHKTCKTRIRSDGRMCHLACIDTGCLCVEGYLRHDNGTCVPINECSPPKCNAHETYSCCGSACPPTCQNRGDNCTACTDQCVEDCFCTKGYVRADDGSCVKPKDCPPRTCNDPNEVFDECPPTCPPTDGCSNIWSKFNCTNAVKCCKPQCRCRSGYYRNNQGICIPVSQCLG